MSSFIILSIVLIAVLMLGFLMGVYYEKASNGGNGDTEATRYVKDAARGVYGIENN
jgi:hypothetical protein